MKLKHILRVLFATSLLVGSTPLIAETMVLNEADGNGQILTILSPDELHLDPASVVIAVDAFGDEDREVNGVLFQSDKTDDDQVGLAERDGVRVDLESTHFIDGWAAAPGFTGGQGDSAENLSFIMEDIRWSQAPNPLTMNISGLNRNALYEIQILVNEGADRDRHWDISVNDQLAVDDFTSEGTNEGDDVWSPENTFVYVGEFEADAEGNLNVVMQQHIGGQDQLGGDNNPILQALVVHSAENTLEEGLLGYWSFNDLKPGDTETLDANNSADEKSNGTVEGDPELVEGPAGEGDIAISFDGIDDAVITEGQILNDVSEFTMSGWVKFEEQPGNRIGFFGQNDSVEFGMINPSTMQHWSAAGGGFDIPFGPAIPEWTCIVLVNKPDERILYVDGEEAARGNGSDPSNSTFPFNIGGAGVYDAAGNYFTGEMDDIAVWNRALTPAEAQQVFDTRAIIRPDVVDTDGDGMGDEFEKDNGLDPFDAADRDTDLDGDGLSNFAEFENRTSPSNKDSDEDGLEDNVETNTEVWVSASDTGTNPSRSDTDRDGLLDGVETNTGTLVDANDTGTDPHNTDTDGDGATDGLEVGGGTDPNDRFSVVSAIFGGAPFTTTHVWVAEAGDQIGDIDVAKEAIEGDTGEKITVQSDFIHFHDNANAPVRQDLSRPYPLWDEQYVGPDADGPGDHNDFAIFSTGEIFIKDGGNITFVCNSDDGFSLEIDGEEIGSAGNRGRGNTDMAVELDAGVHQVNFWHWERGGGAGVSVYIYRGTDADPPTLNAGDYELLQAFDIFNVVTEDTDGDEMDDFVENFFFGDLSRDGSGDFDEDGLSDKEELALRALPNNKDTDGDGLEDGVEVADHNSNPASADTDGDSLADGREVNDLKTDPTKTDTDDDTFDDNVELALGNDPLDAGNKPSAIIAVAAGAWDDPATWSDGLAPSADKNYVAVGTVTGKLLSAAGTFGGDTLTLVGPNMVLELAHSGDALANITLDNADLAVASSGGLGGSLDLRGNVHIGVGGNSLALSSKLSGGANLTIQGGSAEDFQGNVELNGEGSTFGGPIDVIGTDVAGLSAGSLGGGSVRLASGGVAYGYDSSSDLSLLKIQGDNFRLVLGGAIEVADVIGVDADGNTLFSLNELAGPGPYSADDLLGAFQLDEGISGEGTISLLGTDADTDGDGLRDSFETEQLGGLAATPDGDPDGDGLSNLAEQSGGTDPNVPDIVVADKLPQLVVHYDFNEGSGTTINNAAGPNGELVNAHGAAWVESGGVSGSGYLNFDNTVGGGETAQHIVTGIDPAAAGIGGDGEYTMTAWTRFANTAPGGDSEDSMIFGQLSAGNVLHNGARADAYYMGHWGNDLGAGTVVVDEWHHVAWRYKEGNLEIFLDGESIGSDAKGGFQDPAEVVIGATRTDQDRDFSGDLDDIRIYDGAISEAEIKAIAADIPRGGGGAPLYAQNFDAFANDTTDLGDGSSIMSNDGTNSVQDGALRMTAVNVGGSGASFVLPAFDASAGWTATFDFVIDHTDGGNTPADGFSFNYGAIPDGENFGAPAEEGYGEGVPHVSFQVDTWNWNDPAQDAGVGIEVAGVEAAFKEALGEDGANFKPGERVAASATMSWDPANGASFSTTGLVNNADFANVATPDFAGDAAHGFSFLARTGGHTETLIIDNLVVGPLGGSDGGVPGLLGYWPDEVVSTASDHIDLGTLPALTVDSEFTWSFWVNSEETNNNNVVFGNRYMPDGTDFAPREFIKFTPKVFEWHFDGGGENVGDEPTWLPIGVWSHNLVVKAGSSITYYRDGVEIASGEITGAPVNPQPLYLGGQPGTGGDTVEGFSGTFKEVAVFDRALSIDDVTDVYNRGLNGERLDGGGQTVDPDRAAPTEVGFGANGSFGFGLPANASGDVEYSTDLENWEVIATGAAGTFEDGDAGRNAAPAGYYRAK